MPANRLSQYLKKTERSGLSEAFPEPHGFEVVPVGSIPGWQAVAEESRTLYDIAFRRARLQADRTDESPRD